MPGTIQERLDNKFAELRAAEHRIIAAPKYVKVPYILSIDINPVLVTEFSHLSGREHVVITSPEAVYSYRPRRSCPRQ
jgi:hypothetical protein